MSGYGCRFCRAPLVHRFCDLGMSPLSNANVAADELGRAEKFYPLCAFVCVQCWLVQLPEHESPDRIFAQDYAYFSSFSDSWLAHARRYAETMIERQGYGPQSLIVELASNDGYLLQYFQERAVPVLGVEPAANCAAEAQRRGIPTLVRFFGLATAREIAPQHGQADLIVANNVLAHVPDLNDFVAGIAHLLKADGIVTVEFPHLLQLIRGNQFDTIYHEHYSYFSLLTAERVFAAHQLTVFDVEELPTHGGSLRIHVRHAADGSRIVAPAVAALRNKEVAAGLAALETYRAFAHRVEETKFKLLEFLIAQKRAGRKVWAYGAPAKGNTLLNYCGIRSDLIEATVDRSPHKQGLFLPGTRIPIFAPEAIAVSRPDFLLILPWNIQQEIVDKMAHVRQWGGRFAVPIPELHVLP
jgi:SAM-dependent methyltransferase